MAAVMAGERVEEEMVVAVTAAVMAAVVMAAEEMAEAMVVVAMVVVVKAEEERAGVAKEEGWVAVAMEEVTEDLEAETVIAGRLQQCTSAS